MTKTEWEELEDVNSPQPKQVGKVYRSNTIVREGKTFGITYTQEEDGKTFVRMVPIEEERA